MNNEQFSDPFIYLYIIYCYLLSFILMYYTFTVKSTELSWDIRTINKLLLLLYMQQALCIGLESLSGETIYSTYSLQMGILGKIIQLELSSHWLN